MTGIDELRSTLESHAHDLPHADPGVPGAGGAPPGRRPPPAPAGRGGRWRRRGAGRGRRRRPRARPVGDRPQPADGPTVVGLSAPAELEALGYTYAVEQTVDGGTWARLRLKPSDTERLVTWATDGDDQQVTVRSDDTNDGLAYDVPDFGDVVVVSAGEPVDVRVTSETSDVGLAVYTLTDAAPPGVSDGAVTFRRSVADRTLVDAVIGEPGQAEVTLRTVVPDGTLGYAELCVGAPKGAWVDIDLGSRGRVRHQLHRHVDLRPRGVGDHDPGHPRARARSGCGSPTGPTVRWSTTPTCRSAWGSTRCPDDGPRAAGQRVPTVVEEAGHRWELTRVESSEPGDRLLRTTAAEGARPQLVQAADGGSHRDRPAQRRRGRPDQLPQPAPHPVLRQASGR